MDGDRHSELYSLWSPRTKNGIKVLVDFDSGGRAGELCHVLVELGEDFVVQPHDLLHGLLGDRERGLLQTGHCAQRMRKSAVTLSREDLQLRNTNLCCSDAPERSPASPASGLIPSQLWPQFLQKNHFSLNHLKRLEAEARRWRWWDRVLTRVWPADGRRAALGRVGGQGGTDGGRGGQSCSQTEQMEKLGPALLWGGACQGFQLVLSTFSRHRAAASLGS